MGWFDEQIKQRIELDNGVFEDSFVQLADAIMGTGQVKNLYDQRILTKNAIEEICKYYHLKIREIPDQIHDFQEQLEWMLRPHGIMWRYIELEGKWYQNTTGAILAFTRENGQAVAMIPDTWGKYAYKDPTTERKVRLTKESANNFELIGICFYTTFPLKKISVKELLQYMFAQRSLSDLVAIIASTGIMTLITMIMPLLNKILFSDVVQSKNHRVLISMAVFMICVTVSSTLFQIINSCWKHKMQAKVKLNTQAAFMIRVISLPVAFFKKYGAGDLSQRIHYFNGLTDLLFEMILSTGMTGLFSLVYVVQIFQIAPALALPAIGISLATFLVSWMVTFLQMDHSQKMMEMEAHTSSFIYAILTGIQKVRLAGAEKRVFAKWADHYAREARLAYNPPMLLRIHMVITTAIGLLGTMIFYGISIQKGLEVADYYAFTSVYGMLNAAFVQIAGIAMTVAEVKPTLYMVQPFLEAVPEVSEEKEVLHSISGDIECNNVSFRYAENMPNVIDGLNLKIQAGQYVAICGTTGCGKSTLVRLLLGFETPQKGSIYYDGKDIRNVDKKSLRKKTGCVMQNGSLITGDIYSNIVISAPWLTVDEAWEAAELAGIADDIRSLPMGMHTIIAEGQGGFSGGQKQRLMIARAIAAKPKLLILDEATSALDNITQKKVSESLDSLKCTRIVVAHRLSTIKQCDRIIVLDGGHIVEDGTYEELIERKGFFAELVERQRVDQ